MAQPKEIWRSGFIDWALADRTGVEVRPAGQRPHGHGSVYTSRFTGGRNAFEHVVALRGVRQKNGAPGHPQTQGKTERLHQTLQRWLQAGPAARTVTELQRQPDEFREHYNERRATTGCATTGSTPRAG
jgi:transposase InsO family protein